MKAPKFITAFATLLLLTTAVQAEVIPGRWEMVDSLEPGTPIVIKLKTGDRMECSFKESSPKEISFIDESGNEKKVPKAEILGIESTEKTGDGLKNGAWIGAGLGAVGGIVSLYVYADSVTASGPIWGDESAGIFVAAGLVGAGIGALAGVAVDASIKRNEIFYKAP